MIIGIDASRANQDHKTGTEWYSYHLIRNLSRIDKENKYILYTKEPLKKGLDDLGPNFKNKVLKWPPKFMWSQLRLSFEMLLNKPDVLFVPAHTIPVIHLKNTVTTCHDVGFEKYPELYARKHIGWNNNFTQKLLGYLVRIITLGRYSNNELDYHRFSMRFAVKHARTIITPSNFTAEELKKIYKVNPEKIRVTYLGFDSKKYKNVSDDRSVIDCLRKYKIKSPFLVFIGRLERKKNIFGIIKSFLKYKNFYHSPHKLVLIGKRGLGFKEAQKIIEDGNLADEIHELGWIEGRDVALIYRAADALLFLSFYEGFGLPPIEALASGLPVVASNRGSLPEILGNSALYADPSDYDAIAKNINMVISNKEKRQELIKLGQMRIKAFSWQKCAEETLRILTSKTA